MTFKRLAELANTSVGTVSKAFSDSREISRGKKEEIFAIAKREGVFEKYYKGARTRPLIALLCPELGSEYYGRMAGILEDALYQRGCDSVIAVTAFDEERTGRMFSELTGRMKVDGVICFGGSDAIVNPDSVPLVLLGSEANRASADVVRIGTSDAVREAVRLLKEKGHRRVGFIGETLTRGKMEMFRDAMRREGLSVWEDAIVTTPLRFEEGGYSAMKTLLALPTVPTAVFAAYDCMAFGAMRCALDCGYSVPRDISFIGMDDLGVDAYLGVPLTSIKTHIEEACERVVDILLSGIKNRYRRQREKLYVRAELCVRDSVASVGTSLTE